MLSPMYTSKLETSTSKLFDATNEHIKIEPVPTTTTRSTNKETVQICVGNTEIENAASKILSGFNFYEGLQNNGLSNFYEGLQNKGLSNPQLFKIQIVVSENKRVLMN